MSAVPEFAAAAAEQLLNSLQGVKLGSLLEDKEKPVVLSSTDTVARLVETLRTLGIQSTPVREPESAQWASVSALDLVAGAVAAAAGVPAGDSSVQWSSFPEEDEFVGRVAAFLEAPVGSILTASETDPYRFFPPVGTLAQAVEVLAARKHHVMVHEDERVAGIVSQSDVIKFLDEEGVGAKLAKMRLGELGFGQAAAEGALVTCSVAEPLVAAFLSMLNDRVTAVAVLDRNGVLVGSLSASDIRLALAGDLKALLRPVGEFLTGKVPLVCRGNSLLTVVIARMRYAHVHRMWIVDDDGKPTGVFSTSDVCALIAGTR